MTIDPRQLAQAALDRANAATEGPWEWVSQERGIMAHDEMPAVLADPSHRMLFLKPVLGASSYPGQAGKVYVNEADRIFMAAAREDVPALAKALLAALDDRGVEEQAEAISEKTSSSVGN